MVVALMLWAAAVTSALAGIVKQEGRSFTSKQIVQPHVYLENVEAREGKQAFFYYAVDSPDPFMQIAIDYEIRSLVRICNDQLKPNWVAMINSYWTARQNRHFLLCRDGTLQRLPFPDELPIQRIIDRISDSDFDLTEDIEFVDLSKLFGEDYDNMPLVSFPVDGAKNMRRHYRDYPFAGLAVLSMLWTYVNRVLFPEESYVVHPIFKSHGLKDLMLSGLTVEYAARKTLDQRRQWAARTLAREEKNLPTLDMPSVRLGFAGYRKVEPSEDKLLAEYGFGRLCDDDCVKELLAQASDLSLPDGSGGSGLKVRDGGLSVRRGGLNIAHERMGISSGLQVGGTELTPRKYFGVRLSTLLSYFGLSTQLGGLFNPIIKPGFSTVESCDSSAKDQWGSKPFYSEEGEKASMGWFAPSGGIWFRNFDWDVILATVSVGNYSTKDTVKLLATWASRVPNYVQMPKPDLKIINKCKVPVFVAFGRKDFRQARPFDKPENMGTISRGFWKVEAGKTVIPPVVGPDWIRVNRAGLINELYPQFEHTKKFSLCASTGIHDFFIPIKGPGYEQTCKEMGGSLFKGYEERSQYTKEFVVENCNWGLTVCNNTVSPSYRTLSVAIGYLDKQKGEWRSKGWFPIQAKPGRQGCVYLGHFDKPYLLIRGWDSQKKRKVWVDENVFDDDKARFCVSNYKAFDFKRDECPAGSNDRESVLFWPIPDYGRRGGDYEFAAGG